MIPDRIQIESRLAKTVMTASLGAFGMLVAFNNMTDYNSNFQFVKHVLSMDTTFPGNTLTWRAVHVPAVWHFFYALIIAGEATVGGLFAVAALSMARARKADAASFRAARRLVPIATTLGFLIWFFGFFVVGAEWFGMWQSHAWNGQESAFRFVITLLGVCLYVQQPGD